MIQDGVDVEEHEHDVAGVPGVEGDAALPNRSRGRKPLAHHVSDNHSQPPAG